MFLVLVNMAGFFFKVLKWEVTGYDIPLWPLYAVSVLVSLACICFFFYKYSCLPRSNYFPNSARDWSVIFSPLLSAFFCCCWLFRLLQAWLHTQFFSLLDYLSKNYCVKRFFFSLTCLCRFIILSHPVVKYMKADSVYSTLTLTIKYIMSPYNDWVFLQGRRRTSSVVSPWQRILGSGS